jgi:hypothetical protein
MNAENKSQLMTNVVANNFAKKAYRTLLISYRDFTFEEFSKVKAAHNNFATERDREALE